MDVTKIKSSGNRIRSIRARLDPRRKPIINGKRHIVLDTAQQYASNSSAHGLTYLVEDGRPVMERIFWIFITTLALCFTAIQTTQLYIQWKADPVVTSLDTVTVPIEELEFPAVTICPQGAVREIGKAVLFKQFKEYIWKKRENNSPMQDIDSDDDNLLLPEMSLDEMMSEAEEFLRDIYPGAKENPTKMVQVMTALDPKKSMETETLLSQTEEKECSRTSNVELLKTLNKQLKNNTCPDQFDLLEDGICIHQSKIAMTYTEARNYCKQQGGAQLLYFDSYENFKAMHRHKIAPSGK